VIEDLGAIEFASSDRTGTLTENVMHMKKMAVGEALYGDRGCADDVYTDETLRAALSEEGGSREGLLMMLATVWMCHTVEMTGQEGEASSRACHPRRSHFWRAWRTWVFSIIRAGA